MHTLDEDMRALIDGQRLCFAATVTPEGLPNLSPKGTLRVWDDTHLFFFDLASPGTRRNLEVNPWIELNVVDPLSRRGYRFLGSARVHVRDDVYEQGLQRVFQGEPPTYEVHAVILIRIERALPLESPGYQLIEDEFAMRASWRTRRESLEQEFEAHIERRGPWRRSW
jgi:predicted pyridoxine 5'-phosphate oxidase superfamily flavin-nucleotide-binding protein